MTLLLIVISYFVILLLCRNKKAAVPINYDLSVIFHNLLSIPYWEFDIYWMR